MKLAEIFEATRFTRDDMGGTYTPRFGKPKNKMFDAAGHFASVYKKDDSVNKISRHADNLNNDVWFQYAQYVYYNHMDAENPHYPKIESITLKQSDTGSEKALYNIKMERLYDYPEVSRDAMVRMIKQTFVTDKTDEQFEQMNSSTLHGYIKNLMGGKDGTTARVYAGRENIKDEKLIEALDFVQHLVQSKKRAFFDLHEKNFMYRKVGDEVVIVLIDPLARLKGVDL